MAKSQLPKDVLEYFAREGAKGGKIGGKKRMEELTPEQRSELARKGVAGRVAKAAKQAKAKKMAGKKS